MFSEDLSKTGAAEIFCAHWPAESVIISSTARERLHHGGVADNPRAVYPFNEFAFICKIASSRSQVIICCLIGGPFPYARTCNARHFSRANR